MKSVFIFITAIFFSTLAFAQQKSNQIIGVWINEKSDAHIEIFQKGNKYFCKIVWMKAPNQPDGKPKTDKKNPNSRLRDKPIVGLEILSGLEYSDGKWINGKLYSPKEGETVDCSIALTDKNTIKMTASKYGFSTTKIWKRL